MPILKFLAILCPFESIRLFMSKFPSLTLPQLLRGARQFGLAALRLSVFALLAANLALEAPGQQPETGGQTSAPPDQVSAQSAQAQSGSGVQTKRILGIIPNFRAVSADAKLPAQTVKDKFVDATEDSFDYSSIFVPAVLAGYSMGRDSVPQFHQGMAGYARYFWHAAVDQTSENYWVEFIFPVMTREDTRYYTLGRGSLLHRAGYALSRAVVTRSDRGAEVFNISEVFGAGSAAALSNLYYPRQQRSLSSTVSEWGLDIGIDAAGFAFREFWPDINRRVFHNRQPGQ
jgi:hypothetical protein